MWKIIIDMCVCVCVFWWFVYKSGVTTNAWQEDSISAPETTTASWEGKLGENGKMRNEWMSGTRFACISGVALDWVRPPTTTTTRVLADSSQKGWILINEMNVGIVDVAAASQRQG